MPAPCLGHVFDAAIDQKAVAIRYDSENGISERDILPTGIYTTQDLWYSSSESKGPNSKDSL
ncbi:WYL domain-containing protein [Anaerocolumna xylanovorans]